ncbi:MAG: polyprenyl synthetase family protein [Deltaproteobacteria bacterium]|jgi:octaprenyl-diphosphate synthase|nr:polyprenyl synthetase family protein [Deltaproteobacteria bacterium]
MSAGFPEGLKGMAEVINRVLEGILAEDRDLLGEISLYGLYGGGKRLRPAVFLLSWELLGGEPGERALRGASMFEIVHMASLIHDDIVDDADTRRGREAAHLRFGIPEAVLAGDYLVAKAARLCLEWGSLELYALLTEVIRDLSYGELYQLQARRDAGLTREGYHGVISRKTASLLASAAESPAIVLSAPPGARLAMRRYGNAYGMSFQIADDVLDYRGEAAALGKPVLKDLDEGRVTLPLILARDALPPDRAARLRALASLPARTPEEKAEVLSLVDEGQGIERARAEAAEWARQAVEAIAALPSCEAAETLRALALHNAERES